MRKMEKYAKLTRLQDLMKELGYESEEVEEDLAEELGWIYHDLKESGLTDNELREARKQELLNDLERRN